MTDKKPHKAEKKHNINRILLILIIIGSFFLVKGEKVYASVNDIWNYYNYTPTNADANLVFTALITGTLKSTQAYINIFDSYVADNEIMYFQLKTGSTLLDCLSSNAQTKTEWNIPQEPDWNETIIIWEGTQCNVTASTAYEIKAVNVTDPENNLPVQGAWSSSGLANTPLGRAGTSEINDNSTRFLELTPGNENIRATSTSNDLYADLYLNENDYIPDSYIRLSYVRQQNLQSAVTNTDLLWTHLDLNDIITSGYSFVATTTGSLGLEGTYLFKATLYKPSSWWSSILGWFNPFTNRNPDIITSTTTTFIYGEMTTFDRYVASSTEAFDDFIASSTTSYEQVKSACNPISGFDLGICLSGLFIPSSADIGYAVDQFKENISTHFPLGYFSDFIDIISTSTTGTLTVIDAQLPNSLGLGNADIQLDLAHSLDFILNATTSQFSNSSSTGASSTETFYEATSYYWKIIVYIMALIYMLTRVIGGVIHPKKNI